MMRALRFLVLATCLAIAQLALAAHGIEHALHEHDAPCIECLSLPGFAALPVTLPTAPEIEMPRLAADRAVPPAPTFAPHRPYRSRAPPVFPSR